MTNKDLFLALTFYFSKGIGISSSIKLFNFLEKKSDNFFSFREKIKKEYNSKISDILYSEQTKLRVEKELEICKKHNIEIVPFWSDNYPKNLKSCKDAPILLFQKGKIDWNNKAVISVVGTRNITPYGKRCVEQIIYDIKKYNPIIVSGLAYGIDIYSHIKSIENNLQTVCIMGTGFEHIYPDEHKYKLKKMYENGGGATEFTFSEKPLKNNFPRRNRIIAGLADAVIVVESKEKGGSMVTAEIANSYNKDVFAVAGRMNDICSKGCNKLISQNKASIYTGVENLEYFLNWDENKKKNVQSTIFVELTEQEKIVIKILENNSKVNIDELSYLCNIPTFKLTSILLELEIKGLIECLPGKFYSKI